MLQISIDAIQNLYAACSSSWYFLGKLKPEILACPWIETI